MDTSSAATSALIINKQFSMATSQVCHLMTTDNTLN